ncbi:MAG TPA: dienelactone hydrolase family protein [Verrucomicrobiae bacterium]|nr:dienelactone hydrolase family protein [Verrucomicrobiae bacterium]
MNRIAAIVLMLALFGTGHLPAQDWAKARLEKSPRHLEWIKIKHGSREVNCFIAYPESSQKVPAIIVAHEIFGLTDWVRGVADQLAEAGYIAIAPDLLSGSAPGGGGTAELGGNDAVRKAISSLPAQQVTADLDAAADYAAKLPAANGTVAVAGFCWGGGQAFGFATRRRDLKAAFVFYGIPPADEAELARIQCPVFGFYAGNDARVTSTVDKTTVQMKQAGKVFEPVIYPGAGHGFMRAGEAPDASQPNKQARDQAWQRWKELLKKL